MASLTKIALEKFVNEFELENMTPEIDLKDKMLTQKFVNRPALQLTGFFDHFDNSRIQIIGRIEHTYMRRQTPEEWRFSINSLDLKYLVLYSASHWNRFLNCMI